MTLGFLVCVLFYSGDVDRLFGGLFSSLVLRCWPEIGLWPEQRTADTGQIKALPHFIRLATSARAQLGNIW